ncbi:hypothetical protein P3W24_05100 [Luteibacter sp. PPL201]|uniref:Halovibrin HvnA n=1 Tax=Luteibacter sahnii TaxID=3021977 RepID=A0ABT6B8H1_9GAMM
MHRQWRSIAVRLGAGLAVSLGCSAMGSPAMRGAHDAEGESVARGIQARYDDESTVGCNGSPTAPAFLCSGVILRSTAYPLPGGHAWDPKGASNPKPGGISFSWMRRDAQFNKVAHGYAQGFILVPVLKYGGRPFRNMEVMCAYPIDAASDLRAKAGCGAHRSYPSDSGPCQAQGITTANAWVNHYFKVSGEYKRHDHQCGFTMTSGTPNATAVFLQALIAMREIKDESFRNQNELVIQEWSFGEDARLPIEAFFYISGQDGPLGAMSYQQDLYKTTGRWVPVVRLTLASSPGERATFSFRSMDQSVP